MKPQQLAGQTITALNELERILQGRLAQSAPGDNVPDRIAIPKLNRIIRQQEQVTEDFGKVIGHLLDIAQFDS